MFFFQAEDGIRDLVRSRGLGDVYKRQGASWVGVNMKDPVSWQLFYRQVFDTLELGDVLPSLIKSFFFGFIVGAVGCYKGFTTAKGTEGVGRSAHGAVVMASLMIFIIDLLAVQVTDILGLN